MSVQTEDDLWGDPHRHDRLVSGFVTSLVALSMDVPAREILSRGRTTAVVTRARQTAMYLIHVVLGWQLARAAAPFGRDRTTAGHAVQTIEDLRDDPAFDARLATMEACVQQVAGPAEAH